MIEYLIIAMAVSILVPLVLKKGLSNHSISDDKNLISVRRFYFYVGAVGAIFFLLVGIAFCFLFGKDNYSELILCLVLFGFICTIGVYLVLSYRNFKLYLGENELEYTNFLGVKRVYSYSEILKITVKYNAAGIDSYKIHLNKTKITVGYDMINFDNFERIITKRLKKANNLQAIPKSKNEMNAR
ncbi:MAG: hypothetical protein IJW53_01920 [Clostridia bacterium]|nr:hypothetical protein [Clostridia bacterium]